MPKYSIALPATRANLPCCFCKDSQAAVVSIAKEIPALQDYANRMGLIFVMPDGRNLWYWDSISPKVQNMESFITNDLIPYIDTKYPTLAQSSSRAIIPSNIICSSSTTDYIALTINNWLLD